MFFHKVVVKDGSHVTVLAVPCNKILPFRLGIFSRAGWLAAVRTERNRFLRLALALLSEMH